MLSFTHKGPTGQKFAGRDLVNVPRFDQEMQDVYRRAQELAGPGSSTAKMAAGDPEYFRQLEAPAWEQLGAAQGNIASRFSQLAPGASSARRSSGFQNEMGSLSSNFAQKLQSQRMQHQQGAVQRLMEMYHMLMNENPYEQFLMNPKKKKSFWEQLVRAGLPIAGATVGGYFGGPAGAAAGGGLGNTFAGALYGDESQGQGMDWNSIASLPTSWGPKPMSGGSGYMQQPGRKPVYAGD